MEVNNINILYMDNLPIDSKLNFLKEGTILEGEILEIEEQEALIYIEGFGKIKANIQIELNEFMGKEISFLVKSKTQNEIHLKPILNLVEKANDLKTIQTKDAYLIEILNEYRIEEDTVSVEYLNNLMKYNVPVNEKNIISGLKILNKLEQLMNTNEDTHTIINLEEGSEIQKADIRNLLVFPKNREDENKGNLNQLVKNELGESKEIMENIDTDKTNIALKFEENEKQNKSFFFIEDLKTKINTNIEREIDSNIIKTIALFVKYDIKASINNIRYFLELNQNSDIFLKDLELLQKDLKYEKFTILDKKAMINSGNFKNIIEENYIKYKIILEKTMEYIDENSSVINKTAKEKINELQNKLDFLEEINHELSFIYIPLLLNDNYENAITLLKDRKKENNPKSKINIFINLNTNNLGNVKISCEVIADNINIQFSGLKKEDVDLFKNREKELEIAILNTGYILGNIEYIIKQENNILDFLIVNKNPVYYLDVEV